MQAVELVGLPECQLNLAQATTYLASAPKSNASATAIWEASRDVREIGNVRPPAMLRSTGHSKAAKARGHGEGYVSPHDDSDGFALEYLPEQLRSGPGEALAAATTDRRMLLRASTCVPSPSS